MTKRFLFFIIGFVLYPIIANAQIGYQVSLLNSATGEPRANESVKVKIEITNSEGKVICSEEKNATSNEFGVLSLSVGNSTSFDDVDWSKAPFYVSATIDDVLIGKSQILNVPIAEAAKSLVNLSPELLSGTWRSEDRDVTFTFTFSDNQSGSCTCIYPKKGGTWHYKFEIEGNTIWYYSDDGVDYFRYYKGHIYSGNRKYSR